MRWVGGALPETVAGLFDARVIASARLGGGDTGEAYKVRLVGRDGGGLDVVGIAGGAADVGTVGAGRTGGTNVFVKTTLEPRPGMFATEAAGLRWLRETNTVRVPEVLAVRDDPELAHRFLVLEWVDSAPPSADHDDALGTALAELHRFPCARFGLETDNYVGSLPQDNVTEPTWAEFYGAHRLEPLVRRAVDMQRLPGRAVARLDTLLDRLPELVGPAQPPSRLHGDLWAGNAITDGHGRPVVIDPAVYGGHREMDLAMMQLFGGFGPRVFESYHATHPLTDGHAERVALYQLYPILVHVLLFGGSYATTALQTLDRYT